MGYNLKFCVIYKMYIIMYNSEFYHFKFDCFMQIYL